MMEFIKFTKIARLSRECDNCGKEFNPHFSKVNTQKFCSAKCRHNKWTIENRDKLNKSVREYRARRYAKEGQWRDEGKKAIALKAWMVELKSKPCSDCGGLFPICCMDFDHKNDSKKHYNVGSMFAHHYGRELIENELLKCDLVCANCHRIRTRDRRKGNGKHKAST